MGVLEGEQNPKGAQLKANQGCPMPRTACDTIPPPSACVPWKSAEHSRKNKERFTVPAEENNRSLCRGLVSVGNPARL